LLARTRAESDKATNLYVQNNVILLTQLLEQVGDLMGGALEATIFLNGTRNLLVIILQFLVAKKTKQDTSLLEPVLNEVIVVWRQNLQALIDFVVMFRKKEKANMPISNLEWRLWSYLGQLKKEKESLEGAQMTYEGIIVSDIVHTLENVLSGDPVPCRILSELNNLSPRSRTAPANRKSRPQNPLSISASDYVTPEHKSELYFSDGENLNILPHNPKFNHNISQMEKLTRKPYPQTIPVQCTTYHNSPLS